MAQQIQFIYLTQSDFDGLANKGNKLYFTSDTKRIYRGSDLYAATSFDQLTFGSIEASDITVNGSAVSLEGHTHSASDIDGLGAFVSAATQNFSQNGHKHVIADVTNLSGIVAGITNTTVSKSSGSFNTLTVGGSNVSLEGHTHSIDDIEDFDEQGIFEVTGTIDLSNFPSVSVSVNESLADACQAIQDGRPVRLTLQWSGNGYISSFAGIHYTSNGSINELNFIMQLDAAIFNPDQQMHPYMFSLSWYYDENENEVWSLRPYELSETSHEHDIEDINGAVPIEFITSSAFDALSVKDSNTIYFVDDNSIYKGDELYGATTFDQLEFSDIAASSITVNGSAVALDGHTHAFNDITGLSDILSGITSSSIAKDSVSAQTGTFTSSLTVGNSNVSLEGHTHRMSEVTGLQSAIDGLSSIYAGTSHSHAISDITNLSTILTGITESSLTKDTITGDIGNFRLLSVSGSANFAVNNVSANAVSVNGTPVSLEGHTHGVSEVTGLAAAISAATSGFASSQHSHSHADITDFDSAVVSAGSSSFAPISHSHAISSVTGLTASLSELSSSIQSLQSQITPVQCITLAQYEALQTVDASTIYFISDGNRIYRGSVLYAATTFDQLNFSSIEASGITVNGMSVATQDWVTQQIQAAISSALSNQ